MCLPVTVLGLLLARSRGNAPGVAIMITLLLGTPDLAFLSSYILSLRASVCSERIVVRKCWRRDEARWDEMTGGHPMPWLARLGILSVSLIKRGREPLHLFPPFAAQAILAPHVIERVLDTDATASVHASIQRRFVSRWAHPRLRYTPRSRRKGRMINYTVDTSGVTADQLQGFFVNWPDPPTPDTHLRLLHGSDAIELAIDAETGQVVGFATAITDGVLSAYIPLLEVLPGYQGRGIGSELIHHLLKQLEHLYIIDLLCDVDFQPFYEKQGLRPASGMMVRNYARQSGHAPPPAEAARGQNEHQDSGHSPRKTRR